MRVITTDARVFEGKLEGFDNMTNVVLTGCVERVLYEDDEDNDEIPVGVYLLRGQNIVCVAELDVEVNDSIDWKRVKGLALKGTKNPL